MQFVQYNTFNHKKMKIQAIPYPELKLDTFLSNAS